nr:imidazoleglycerol-phosphate dehydratase HisB [Desulfobacterales bacterium]
MSRSAQITRRTRETDIGIQLTIDGEGKGDINTRIPFLDHMLTLMATHGFFDISIDAKGDVEVDDHHIVEDVGLVLGQAFREAIGDCRQMKRYGNAIVPMDEALTSVVLDFSNRPYLSYSVPLNKERIGNLSAESIKEFFRAFVRTGGITLHINVIYGENTHHIIEAIFKATGRALDEATTLDKRIKDVLSTKGTL